MYLSLICKPTHKCNLNCSYCYDAIARKKYPNSWTDEMVDRIAYLIGNSHDSVSFTWHGGECLTLGHDWIIDSTKHIKNVAEELNPNIELRFNLQSNGLLLTKEVVDELLANKIMPAASYDGKNYQWKRSPNEKTRELIADNVKYLYAQESGGTVSVISNDNVGDLISIYEELKEMGAVHLAFNIVFSPEIGKEENKNLDLFIDGWNKFFDYWLYDKSGISERTCTNYLRRFFNDKNVVCERNVCLNHFLCIDNDGNIFPCDSAFKEAQNEDYLLGNIFDENLESFFDVFESEKYKLYKKNISKKLIDCISNCEIYHFCKGGCPSRSLSNFGDYTACDLFMKKWQEAFIEHIFEKIKNLSTDDLLQLNSVAYSIIASNGYISLKDIQDCFEKSLEEN